MLLVQLIKVRNATDYICHLYLYLYFSFSTGFLTIMIQAGCLSIISFFIKKYRGNFVIAETHLDWRVSFLGKEVCMVRTKIGENIVLENIKANLVFVASQIFSEAPFLLTTWLLINWLLTSWLLMSSG